MEKNKLFEILSTFTPKEFENFGLFLDSPFLNSSELARNFYKLYSKHFPVFDNKALGKEELYKKLYPGTEFRDKRLRDIYSKTLELAEYYLGFLRIKNDEALLGQTSLEEIASRGLTKHFSQKSRELSRMLSKWVIKDSNFLYNSYYLAKQERQYYQAKKNMAKQEEFYLSEGVERHYFILYFASVMLEYFIDGQINLMLVKYDAKFEMIEEILRYLELKDLEQYPQILAMYYGMLLSRNTDLPDLYGRLKTLLLDRTSEIDIGVLRRCSVILYNHAKEKSLKKEPFFMKENFDLMKLITEKGFYPVENGFMNEMSYLATIGEGLIHKDFDWTLKFIKEFREKVRPEGRENAYLFATAVFDYRIQKYSSALEKLAMVKTDDIFYTLRVKNNQVKIHVETKEYELAERVISSFRRFLQHDKLITDFIRNRFLGYLSFTSKLISAIQDKNRTELAVLKTEISKAKDIENQKWMLDQVDCALAMR